MFILSYEDIVVTIYFINGFQKIYLAKANFQLSPFFPTPKGVGYSIRPTQGGSFNLLPLELPPALAGGDREINCFVSSVF